MPCIFVQSCNNEFMNASDGWGMSHGVCAQHFATAKEGAIHDGYAALQPDLLENYASIWLLLEKYQPKVKECLRALASEFANLKGRVGYIPRAKGKEYTKFAEALEQYEGYRWSPRCRERFIAQLAADQFFGYLALPLMAKS